MRLQPSSHWLLPAALAVAAIAIAATPLGHRADRALFDVSTKLVPASGESDVVLVAIDEISTAKLGADVWKPDFQVLVLERVLGAGARAVGYVQFKTAPRLPSGALHELRDRFNRVDAAARPALFELDQSIGALERTAAASERLNQIVQTSDRVVLPVGSGVSNSLEGSRVISIGQSQQAAPAEGNVANVDFIVDEDGSIRSLPVRAGRGVGEIRAMPLELARRAKLAKGDYNDAPDGRLWLTSPLVAEPEVTKISIADVAADPTTAQAVAGKIVLIGATVGATAMPIAIHGRAAVPLAILQAKAVSKVISDSVVVRSRWLDGAAMLLCIATVALPWLSRRVSIEAFAAIAVGWAFVLVGCQLIALAYLKAWLPSVAPTVCALLMPLCALRAGHLPRRGLAVEKTASHGDDRLMALAFHEQGQLDHAFDHLRKCPPTEAVLDDLYELGLDYERRRQYAKAQQVFDYIAARSPQRRELLKRSTSKPVVTESVQAVSDVARSNVGPLTDAVKAKTPQRLGRYELGKELGRGAMGVVYLGRDTTIGRAVAIKTLPLSQEFDAAEVESVKKRFFGEAESAGRLNHPSIVTIYDAGEDQDLAYIAMELLTGKDLSRYTAPRRLLPLAVVLNITARVADALDYAHRLNIVHRDIKPGNIMFDPKTDAVKVTDFGIARITDSNKTKTGMVLGTPSFMSPEQLAGKKIDGQSDLYSLGVTLYQLACGTLPFQAASLAQLMYKISNDPPADPLMHNPSLPDSLVGILKKVLAKNKQERFASGAEMALALRDCASQLAVVDIAL